MFGNQPRELPQPIGFVMIPNFSMIAFTSAVEPLRIANRLSGRNLYDWRLYSVDGGPIESSSRIEVHPVGDLDAAAKTDTLIVCSGVDVHKQGDKRIFSWLRRRSGSPAALAAWPANWIAWLS